MSDLTQAAPAQGQPAPSEGAPSAANMNRQLLGSFQQMIGDSDPASAGDDGLGALLGVQPEAEPEATPEAPAEPELHQFDDAALDRDVEYKANGEVKRAPLREVLRLASLADGAHQRLQMAREQMRETEAQRAEIAAVQAEASEIIRDPARFFEEMLLSETDAIGYVTQMVQIAQRWLNFSEHDRAALLRERRSADTEAWERETQSKRVAQAERQSIEKVIGKAGVPEYLQPYIRGEIANVVNRARGKQQLTVSQLVEHAKKRVAAIEQSARESVRTAQQTDATAAAAAQAARDKASKPVVASAPAAQPRNDRGQFDVKPSPKIDPFNPRSYRQLVR